MTQEIIIRKFKYFFQFLLLITFVLGSQSCFTKTQWEELGRRWGDEVADGMDDLTGLIAKWDNLTLDELKQLFSKISKTDIKAYSTKQWGAKTANDNFKLEYITEHIDFNNYIPPYKKGTFADQIELAEDALFVRVHGARGQAGRWMMTIEDYKRFMQNPDEFKDIFALPSLPSKSSLVKVPKGTTIWKGQASGNKWGTGGGVQIQIDNWEKIPLKEKLKWFKNLENL